ncbi:Cytosolic carboxypeptidase 1 [Phlyctochytrium planicorne]|nr:Cytosolic carboxypeptidase 1 [Phlyctochytrium planicorne]
MTSTPLISSAANVIPTAPPNGLITSNSAPASRRPSVKAPLPFPRHYSEPSLFQSNITGQQFSNYLLSQQQQQNQVPEKDLRRRIIKQCLELKRHIDKEGPYLTSDSALYKVLFARTPGACGVNVLLKSLKVLPDIDVSIIITNLLIRMAGSHDCNQTALAFLARRNATTAIFRNLQGIQPHLQSGTPPLAPSNPSFSQSSSSLAGPPEPVSKSASGTSAALTASRIDELLGNLLTLICKLSKNDPKLPLIARLHGAIETVVDIFKRCYERKDSSGVLLALQTLKVLSSKADTNVLAMHKKGVLEVMANVLKSLGSNTTKETSQIEALIDLLTIFSKTDQLLKDILRLFGTRFFVTLFTSSGHCESLQKCCLKLLRSIVLTDDGRRAFSQTDGIDVLTASLEMMALQADCTLPLQGPNSMNSLPSLLIGVLRAAVSETDLPHMDLIRHRISPLDSTIGTPFSEMYRQTPPSESFPNSIRPRLRARRPYSSNQPSNESSSTNLLADAAATSQSTPPQTAASISHLSFLSKDDTLDDDAEVAHLRSLCPEFEIAEKNGVVSLPSPSSGVLRAHKAVAPTNLLIPGALINVARITDQLKPSPTVAGILPNNISKQPGGALSIPSSNVSTPAAFQIITELHSGAHSNSSSSSSSSSPPSTSPLTSQPSSSSLTLADTNLEAEPLQRRSTNSIRRTVFEQTTRILKPGMFTDIVVYDVMDDSTAAEAYAADTSILLFESKFESGNLQLAIRASESEYDLILQNDIGSVPGKHNQWFYFSVTNMVVNQPYKFNIINMSKGHSQFAEGMQPVVYSIYDKVWRRGGDSVCFYKNHYRKPKTPPKRNGTPPIQSAGKNCSSTYSTLSFCFTTSNPRDILYIAYHYPYTASDLTRMLNALQFKDTESQPASGADSSPEAADDVEGTRKNSTKFDERCRRQTLCLSEGGNEVDLLTITAFDRESITSHPIAGRVYIFLSSRVHPGESNSSYIMQGVIRFLMGDDETATALRRACIFKIVPMLNPDGAINGSHRCGLSGVDLNREWRSPCKKRSPTIYWTKQLWKFLVDGGHRPLIACDFHGHSRKKNVFIFGCENGPGHAEGLEKIFPSLLASVNSMFDSGSCKYVVERSKEATARVVIWREMGVVGSYTLESTYCGADIGDKKVPVATPPVSAKKESRQDSKDTSSSGEEK